MSELKRCPFCGGNAKIYTRWATKPRDTGYEIPIGYYIMCEKCFCQSRFVDAKNQDRIGKEYLIHSLEDEWNRRVSDE